MLSGAIAYFRALTSLHPGAGSAIGAIDMPVQREAATRWPMMQSGGVKGVFRDKARVCLKEQNIKNDDSSKYSLTDADNDKDLTTIFGPAVNGAGEFAGALIVTDARILLFPVRSLKGVFALVTCPSVLQRFAEDCKLAELKAPTIPEECLNVAIDKGICLNSDILFFAQGDNTQCAVLEDISLIFEACNELTLFGDVSPNSKGRIVVVNDDVFNYQVQYRTEVITRNAINFQNKTVIPGALFNQEFLPPQTLMYSVLLEDRVSSSAAPDTKVLEVTSTWINGKTLQFGGDATTGKGQCKVTICKAENGGG